MTSNAAGLLSLCKKALPQLEAMRDAAPNEEAREIWVRAIASVMMVIECALGAEEVH